MEVTGILPRLWQQLLPPRCILCGDPTGGGRLCPPCSQDLPGPEPACPRCAAPVAATGMVCGQCLRHPPPFDACRVGFDYAGPIVWLHQRFKFEGDLACGRAAAEALAHRLQPPGDALPERLVPVPLSGRRLRERGFNQALELARPLADALGLPIDTRTVRRVRDTPPQAGLSARERRSNLRRAFEVSGPLHGASVAIFDDVITTGSTAAEIAKCLRRAGAGRIEAWGLARSGRNLSIQR